MWDENGENFLPINDHDTNLTVDRWITLLFRNPSDLALILIGSFNSHDLSKWSYADEKNGTFAMPN